MADSYEHYGRSPQKARTRAALVAATRQLLARGIAPTVEQDAELAAVEHAERRT